MPKTALLLGATGLVGNQLLEQLLDDARYESVVALSRRPLEMQHPKLRQEIIDFDHPDPAKIKGDDLFCALGTTLRKAGSKEAQYRIDCTYPYEIGKIARQNGVRQYLLVSSKSMEGAFVVSPPAALLVLISRAFLPSAEDTLATMFFSINSAKSFGSCAVSILSIFPVLTRYSLMAVKYIS